MNPQDQVQSYAIDCANFKDNLTLWTIHFDETKRFYCNTWKKQLKQGEIYDEPINFILKEIKEPPKEIKEVQQKLQIEVPPHEVCDEPMKLIIKEPEKVFKGAQQSLQVQLEIRPYCALTNKYDNFDLRDKLFSKCYARKMTVSARHVIVNKTDIPIKIGLPKKHGILLQPHSSTLYYVSQNSNVCFKVNGYSKFSIN